MLDFDVDPERVAYHEAGHAVAGLGLGMMVTGMQIRTNCSATTYFGGSYAQTPDYYHKKLIVAVAGPVAELLLHESLEGPCDRRERADLVTVP